MKEWMQHSSLDARIYASGSAGDKPSAPNFENSSKRGAEEELFGSQDVENSTKRNKQPTILSKSNLQSSSTIENQNKIYSKFTVPTKEAWDCKFCTVCGESFNIGWNEDDDEWQFENAILDEEDKKVQFFIYR